MNMGGLIPTPNDQEICARLNKRFSDLPDPHANPQNPEKTMIGSVRFLDSQEGGLLFGRNLNLARLAHRLGGVPSDQASRLRWFFLLRRSLPRPTKVAISKVLEKVMGAPSIKQVFFDVVHDGSVAAEFELDPGNSTTPQIQNLPSAKDPTRKVKTCVILLRCHFDEPLPDPRNEPDPPVPVNPESGPTNLP
jgi:hypothetical protein